jgi:hypothetical protein
MDSLQRVYFTFCEIMDSLQRVYFTFVRLWIPCSEFVSPFVRLWIPCSEFISPFVRLWISSASLFHLFEYKFYLAGIRLYLNRYIVTYLNPHNSQNCVNVSGNVIANVFVCVVAARTLCYKSGCILDSTLGFSPLLGVMSEGQTMIFVTAYVVASKDVTETKPTGRIPC